VNGNPNRLVALDGWRAIAATIVILGHLQQYSSLRGVVPLKPQIEGAFGVELFFGISGFVICRGLLREWESSGRISLLGFYIRRVFRIIPPLAMYLGVIVLLALLNVIPPAAAGAVRALTFTCNLQKYCGGWFGDHTWSLSVEEQFYVVIPLLIALCISRSKAVLAVALLAFPFLVAFLHVVAHSYLGAVLVHFVTIGLGVVCALYEERARAIVARLPGWSAPAAFILAAVIWKLPAGAVAEALKLLVVPYLIMLTLLGTAFRRTVLDGLLSSRPVQAVGAASYSLYLWQQLATYAYPGAGLLFYAASVGASVLAALVSFRWIETPLIRLGASLSRQVRERRLAVAAG
jgi:peptidoglycan/LPS O-acetylase OafA/YrhL